MKTIKTLFITSAALLMFACSNSVPLLETMTFPLTGSSQASSEAIAKSIRQGAALRGWTVVEQKEHGALLTTNVRGKHRVRIEVIHEGGSLRFNYIDSVNLDYRSDKNTIHKNYGRWIANLAQAINASYQVVDL